MFSPSFIERLRKVREPEKRLMVAIFEDAVEVYFGDGAQRTSDDRHLRRAVDAWLDSDAVCHPLSFRRICDELCIDPASVRAMFAQRRSDLHRLRGRGRSADPARLTA
jgi:hypothetical protein